MKELLIEKLYDFWNKTDDDKETLLKEITQNVNDGISGAEVLLDWCRNDYDTIKEQYQKLHNLTDNEMDKKKKHQMYIPKNYSVKKKQKKII